MWTELGRSDRTIVLVDLAEKPRSAQRRIVANIRESFSQTLNCYAGFARPEDQAAAFTGLMRA